MYMYIHIIYIYIYIYILSLKIWYDMIPKIIQALLNPHHKNSHAFRKDQATKNLRKV